MLLDHLIEARMQDWWNPQPMRPRCSITLKGRDAVRQTILSRCGEPDLRELVKPAVTM